jgi:hypothetical protein
VCSDYNTNLRKYTGLKKKMHWKMVHKHFTKHDPSAVVMNVNSLKYMNDCMETISVQNTFMRSQSTHRETLNASQVKLYMTLFDKRAKILKEIQASRSRSLT